MSTTIEIDGKILHPIKEAVSLVSYSRDYVTRLARENKIFATTVGRQWFVSVDSLKAYAESSRMEQDIRKQKLSEERKAEKNLRDITEGQADLYIQKSKTLHNRAVAFAALVLMAGVSAGLIGSNFISSSQQQLAQVSKTSFSATSNPVSETSVVQAPVFTIADSDVSYSVDSLGDIESGILLLPGADSVTATEMFSDNVIVKKLADDSMVIIKTNADGVAIGTPVPFVTVPAKSPNI